MSCSSPRYNDSRNATVPKISSLKLLGLGAVFLWFLIGGIAHFAASDLEVRIVPPALPWPRAIVFITGVLELAGAAGLLYPPTRRAAGWGLFALTIAVTPANLFMLQHAELFAVPYWALVLRLPLQGALLVLIWWSTKPPDRRAAPHCSRSRRHSTIGAIRELLRLR
jgi:uncharacterized membrane protein